MTGNGKWLSLHLRLFKNGTIQAKDFFELVSRRLRSGELAPDEAEIIAGWFDCLAQGKTAKQIFSSKGGRPRGTTSKRKAAPNGKVPDDVDIAWIVRRMYGLTPMTWKEVEDEVGKRFGLDPENVKGIYKKYKKELAPDPEIQGKKPPR
jgi:hypothetical protein